MLRIVGNGETQFNNVFGDGNSTQSNVIVPIQSATSIQNSAPIKGGKRRRKGGFFGMGGIINQAVVPLAILGMQQTYGRKHNQIASHRGTRRGRR
jgi:hypothetical protein